MGATTILSSNSHDAGSARPKHVKPHNVPRELVDAAQSTKRVPFDANQHLNFKEPEVITRFADIGQPDDGISPVAISEPFTLFTEEAVKQMRAEILDEDNLNRHFCATSPSSGIIRGHCPKYATFTNSVWNSPEVLDIVSSIAGVELVPAIDYDVAHVNFTMNAQGDENAGAIAPGEAKGEDQEFCESAFGWHRDSYPFVCVTMLSDCTGMIGGETKIRTGSGDVMKARGPAMGMAVVMQGRHLDHQATAALGGKERTSMVCSFRPKNPLTKDETRLRNVRNISHLATLYEQYTTYRLEILEDRTRDQLRRVRKRYQADEGFDITGTREWLIEQKAFLDKMLEEVEVR